jgi:thioesterase domain-containing protein
MWCHTDLSLQHIHSRLAPGTPFSLLGYSFGGLLALELALELEAEGREGHLYLLDSAPVFMKLQVEHVVGSDEKKFETSLICRMFSIVAPHEATAAAVSKVFPVRNVKHY